MKQNMRSSLVLVAVIFMDLLAGMEFDLFVPSFPELQTQFGLSAFAVETLLSVNFLGYCLSLFFVGGLADRYGRKPIILLGLMIFVMGSILCLGSVSYLFLLIGRFLQGVGVAAPAILSFLIIADLYPLKQQQFLLALLNGSMNAAAAAAPVIGSYITLYFHWQGNFRVLLFLGLITGVITLLFVPAYARSAHPEISSPQGYIAIVRSKPLLLLIVNIFFMFVPYWIFVGISPLLYMKALGVSLSDFGYYQGVLALVFALGSLLFGWMIQRFDFNQKKMLSLSIKIYAVGFVLMLLATLFNSNSPLWITVAFLFFVIGQIIPTTILYPLSINFMPQAKGRVSAIIQGGRLIFAAVGLQMAGYFYVGSFQNIGIIISGFIGVALTTLFFVIQQPELMKTLE